MAPTHSGGTTSYHKRERGPTSRRRSGRGSSRLLCPHTRPAALVWCNRRTRLGAGYARLREDRAEEACSLPTLLSTLVTYPAPAHPPHSTLDHPTSRPPLSPSGHPADDLGGRKLVLPRNLCPSPRLYPLPPAADRGRPAGEGVPAMDPAKPA